MIGLVEVLTKKGDYESYIKHIKEDKDAEIVKAADIIDNGYDLWANKGLLMKDKEWFNRQLRKERFAYSVLANDLPPNLKEGLTYVHNLLTSTFTGRP